ncbi:MAG: hypothetical protein RLZZ502_941 [Pseudomonadota bacterium]
MFRLFGLFVSVRAAWQFVIDVGILLFSWYAAVLIRLGPSTWLGEQLSESLLYTVVCIGMLTASGVYQASRSLSLRQILFAIGIAFGLSIFTLLALSALFQVFQLGRGLIAIAVAVAIPLCFLSRLIFNHTLFSSALKIRVLVLGSGQNAADVVRYISEDQEHRYFLAGICSLDNDTTLRPYAPVMEGDIGVLAAIERTRPDMVVVAMQERRGSTLPMGDLLAARLKGTTILELSTFFEQTHGSVRLEHLRSSWLVYGEGFRRNFLRSMIKRLFDLMMSVTMLLLASPIMLLAALAIKLSSRGPVLYRQERVGLGGNVFNINKFRSMRTDAEADGTPQWAKKSDSRVTFVGRYMRLTRIDELPQLFNVLSGDMSFVGPRPERPFFVQQLKAEIPMYDARHSIKPGITGWAQVRAEYGASIIESKTKLEFDLYYLKHYNLTLDLLIILETVGVVVSGRGAR